jgi:uncharacterized protein
MRLAIILLCILTFSMCSPGQQPAQPAAESKPVGLSDASISTLQQRADAGDAQAQFELARAYEDGKGLPQDDTKAVEWFRKSADQGNAQAQNSLGVMYALGRGVTRDREEAVRWYKKAAKTGLPDAMYNVAISYYNGEGVDSSMDSACTWMTAAQRKGDPQAAEALKHIQQEAKSPFDRCRFDLAGLYEKGGEIPQDLPAAAAIYTDLAQQNNKQFIFASPAQYKLCLLYIAGKGVPRNDEEAKKWCTKAAQGGITAAYFSLGRMAELGVGSPKDLRRALEYYQDAAAEMLGDAYMELGRIRASAGTHNDDRNAYFWYLLAQRKKINGAEAKMNELASRLSASEIDSEMKDMVLWNKTGTRYRLQMARAH